MAVTLSLGKKGRKLARIICAGNPQWLKAVFSGVAAGIEHRHVLPNLDTLRTVVDVGANHGQFALVVRHCSPEANVFSFEPLSGPAAKFRKVFQDDSRVVLHQSAIGPETGTATMHVAAADDSSSLLPISNLQQHLFPGTGEVRTEKIQVGRLSDFLSAEDIKAPALLKLDVQASNWKRFVGVRTCWNAFHTCMPNALLWNFTPARHWRMRSSPGCASGILH